MYIIYVVTNIKPLLCVAISLEHIDVLIIGYMHEWGRERGQSNNGFNGFDPANASTSSERSID